MAGGAVGDYAGQMANLYDGVPESPPHKYCMGYSLKGAIGSVEGHSCLEVACGNGAYMEYLHSKGASFVVGTDLSADNLEVARKAHAEAGIPAEKVNYVEANALTAGLIEGGPFDLVLMGCCVCYSSSMEELLAWMRHGFENLKPGGRLVVMNTRGALPKETQEELAKLFDVKYEVEADGGSKSFGHAAVQWSNGWSADYFFITGETVGEAMAAVGFEVEKLPVQADPAAEGTPEFKAKVARLPELMPYDLFRGTRPTKASDAEG